MVFRERITLDFIATLAFATAIATSRIVVAQSNAGMPSPALATVQEMIQSRTDVWGDAAMRQPNGASYDFVKDLLPPLRWVNTQFRHYPIVLSAPRAAQKVRLVSNGSAVNPRANKRPMWTEQGTPVSFFIGDSQEQFGEKFARLEQPEYLDGFLPIVTIGYRTADSTLQERVFAPVSQKYAPYGAAFVRFSVAHPGHKPIAVEARIDSDTPLHADRGAVRNAKSECVVSFANGWKWIPERKALVGQVTSDKPADLAIFTKPTLSTENISATEFDSQERACIAAWRKLLDDGAKFATPELLVNNAWRALLIGNYLLAVGDRLNYSAGNAYAKLYEGECGDTLRSIMLFGHLDNAPAMLKPLLQFDRKATRFHVAGHKLQLLAYFYWLTRDARTVREYEPLWRPSIELILANRDSKTGLLPKDNYAGDIAEQVYSLNSNANCWRGLRDVAAMLDDMGGHDEAVKLQNSAKEYRTAILKAADQSIRRDSEPPFIPVALLADEPAHDPLTATRTGSYYDLICPYVIGSEIFGQGTPQEDWLLGYMQQHGGIALGMVRTRPAQGEFKDQPGVVPLYGVRYQLALLRRDEREKALVGFYGQLAQGMTRGTFIGGEGNRFVHGDADGRSFYLPPNSASNAAWLISLRYLLIQDWDLDENGKPDTLRLLYGVPRGWLADGSNLQVSQAPTMFGAVSLKVQSRLSEGSVNVRVDPPARGAEKTLLRAPVPAGFKVESADIDGSKAELVGTDAVDLTGRSRPMDVTFHVRRN